MPSEVGTEGRGSEVLPDRALRYRPYLDGLRTVAVYLVVAFHAGLGLFSGGFIGVDIFFVLSGFLVTQILMRDLASIGRIQWRQFYSRRVRRILPAALVALVVTALVYSIVATPAEMLDALGGFRAALFYVANWFFIHQSTNYFAANVNSSPVLHFWSLAIEEQFYLIWPLLLGGLYLATRHTGRRRWWIIRTAVIAAAAASATAALHLGSTNINRAYYGTDTRAYELLAGAALALTPQLLHLNLRNRNLARRISALTLAALLALATSALDMSPITRGVLVAALAPILLIALENTRHGYTKRILSSTPFTYLGRISYGTYLWHWPVIVIIAHNHNPNPTEMFAISATTATTLAALSYHLIEHPIRAARTLNRFKTPVIAIGFATSILTGALAIPAILDSGTGPVGALAGARSRSGLRLLDWRVAKNDIPDLPDCIGAPVSRCNVVKGNGKRVLLIGDSNARMWIPTFTEIAKQRGWNFSVAAYPTCPWQRDIVILYQTINSCRAHHDDWYRRVIPQFDPDIVLLAHQAFDDPGYPLAFVSPDRHLVRPPDSAFESTLIDASSSSLRALQRPGREIVIIEPIPDAPPGTNPLSCLSTGGATARCAYAARQQPTPLERFYRTQGTGAGGVVTLDLSRLVCPRWPTCDPIIDSIIVKRDANHLTATFARSIADEVAAKLPQ